MPDATPIDAPSVESGGAAMLAALRSVHETLDTVELRDEGGNVVGWTPLDGATPDELAELVQLLTTLEATLRGVRLGEPQQLVSDSDRS